ncbi:MULTISPECIES: hypothetical protein [Planktothricoides]|uniref:Uncharacterized protein n=1 Tax=Planktothricoides raciborskii GIHE-MW2 TaxID=2792601 RepID=A0AAU8J6M3_9CYAN|nr:hypothetical protein [Planktothricoides sp. SR001]KOR36012.1 hypothetical protein AM228_14775 [Planktothricoides sp. SR001]
MMSPKLLEIDRTIRNLSLAEQQWLLDRLTKQVQERTQSRGKFSDLEAIKQQLEDMANDPDIQREIAEINQEFAIAEMDGLENVPHSSVYLCVSVVK